MEDYSGYFRQGDLIAKYLRQELSPQEQEELENWVAQSDRNRLLFKKLTEEGSLSHELEQFASNDKEAAWDRIVTETGFNAPKRAAYIVNRLVWLAAALVLLVSGLLVYRASHTDKADAQVALQKQVIVPGSNKAVLTLADASQIILDDATAGEIAKQADMVITKTPDGQVVYASSKTGVGSSGKTLSALTYNTISTPRGGKFRIVLPDGSKVWLNAASSLKYPTKFQGDERKVALNGEAYFEIKPVKNLRQEATPFQVISAGQIVEVLGTHFNINSYADENSVKTTLLEGKVKVIKTQVASAKDNPKTEPVSALILKPGEQAQLAPGTKPKLNLIPKVDVEEAVAWKNGQFQFKDTDLPTIMRQIARWYDVEVDFQGKSPDMKFRGKISRDVPLSQIFQILQLSGVNFKLEGRKIIVKS